MMQAKKYPLGIQTFSETLVKHYAANNLCAFDDIVLAYANHMLANEDVAAFLPHLKVFYDKFPYTVINNNERHYQAVMFTIFSMLGAHVQVEEPTPDGRIDMVQETDQTIYIFELKYNKTAADAMAQIEQKDYTRKFVSDSRRIVKVGLNFSEDRRSLEEWSVEAEK